jgi:hypothetical protein
MKPIPEYLKPAVGYAMWHIRYGPTPGVVPWGNDRHGRFDDLSAATRLLCIRIAQYNIDLCNLFNDGADDICIDDCVRLLGERST